MVPELVFSDGSTANMQQGILLHHFVFFNPSAQALACSNSFAEPFWGSGNERTPLHLPSPYGYGTSGTSWSMLTHLVNLNTQAKTVYVQVIYRTRPNSETEPTRPVWLDIDSFCNGGDSEYTIPTGYSDTHVDWTSTIDGRVINAWGHLHDIDIIDSNPCQTHCPERGGGIALSAEVRGGPSSDYFGPIPPNNPPPAAVAAVATPRRADGKPDLTGVWGGGYNPITGGGTRRCGPTQTKVNCNIPMDNFWVDYEWLSPWRFGVNGLPTYKPEYWDKIQELDQWTNKYDPVMTCQPLGLPRHGTPRRIVQQDKDVIFFYGANADYGGGAAEFRDIPTDGRARNTRTASQAYYYGNSVGKWEGDTLVIDSINFVDTTWLGRGGLIHSSSMHIIERLTRVGNEIRYDMTIEDPEMFVEPFVMPTRVLREGAGGPFGGDGIQAERSYCEVYEEGNVTNQLRH